MGQRFSSSSGGSRVTGHPWSTNGDLGSNDSRSPEAVGGHFPCLNISNPKYIRINNLSLVLSKGMELGSDTAHSC